MHGDWFCTTKYGIFGDGGNATKKSPLDNLTQWVITQSKGFTRGGTEETGRSVRAYVYLVLTCQVQAGLSIVGNSASAVDAQQVFKSTCRKLINEDYSISADIDNYQGILEHALSEADFSVGTGIYMLPSILNVSIGQTIGYNNKILISNTGMKIGSNKDINKDHKKMIPPGPDGAEGAVQAAPKMHLMKSTYKPIKETDNQRMLAEKHNDEKLATTILIVRAGLVAYHFW